MNRIKAFWDKYNEEIWSGFATAAAILAGATVLTLFHVVLEFAFSFATGLPRTVFANVSHFWEILGLFGSVFLFGVWSWKKLELWEEAGVLACKFAIMSSRLGIGLIAVCIIVAALFCRISGSADVIVTIMIAEWIYRLNTVALGVFYIGVYSKISIWVRGT